RPGGLPESMRYCSEKKRESPRRNGFHLSVPGHRGPSKKDLMCLIFSNGDPPPTDLGVWAFEGSIQLKFLLSKLRDTSSSQDRDSDQPVSRSRGILLINNALSKVPRDLFVLRLLAPGKKSAEADESEDASRG